MLERNIIEKGIRLWTGNTQLETKQVEIFHIVSLKEGFDKTLHVT